MHRHAATVGHALLAPTQSGEEESDPANSRPSPSRGSSSGHPTGVERIREYQDRGVGHFLFTFHTPKSDYLHIIATSFRGG